MDNKRGIWRSVWPPIAVLGAVLIAWQAAASLGYLDHWIIPSPLAVAQEAIAGWPRLMMHTGATVQLMLLGFAGGTAAGFVIAALLHLLPGVRRGLYPLLILSQNVPVIVLGPILAMMFGYGLLPRVLLVMMVCFFPVSLAMLNGLGNTDAVLRNYLQMIGIRKWQQFWQLELPHAVTHIFSGLKIAATYSVLSAVIAEWLGGTNKGLGSFMLLSSKGFMPERVFAATAIIVALSLLMVGIIAWAERAIVRWRPPVKDGR